MSRGAASTSWVARVMPAVAAPVSVAVFTVAGALQAHRQPALVLLLGTVVAVVGAALVRTDATGGRLAAGLLILTIAVGAACWGDPRNLGWFGVCVIAGWAALALPARGAIAAGAALASGFVAMLVLVSREPGWMTWTCGVVLTCGAFLFVRRQRDLVTRLHAAHTELAERARADERHRIAREMHDLVGHRLTVTLLHLGSARLALDDDPDAARAGLGEAERAARGSLEDVRGAVALLRTGDAADPRPAPAATGIPELVDAFQNAGVQVDLELHGDLSRLAPAPSLAAYRITQESLTNAARHGDGTPIVLRVNVSETAARLVVRNTGAARTAGRGTGVAAMRERAAAAGGALTAGPDRGTWLVEAVIPV